MKYLQFLLILSLASTSLAQTSQNKNTINDLKNEQKIISKKTEFLSNELDSMKNELKITRALLEADKKRAMDTLEYASKIVDWSVWILSFLGILFITIGFIVGYLGIKEVRDFKRIRKRMNHSFNVIRNQINEFQNMSKNLINIIFWSNEGWNKYICGNYDRAEYLFTKIKEIRADDYETRYRLGKVYSAMRKYDNASNEFIEAIKIDDNNGDAYFGLGWNYKNQRKYDNAIDAYQKGLKITPNSYGLCGLGHVYMEAGKLNEAKECFINSINKTPNSGASFPLANIFMYELNTKKAYEYYQTTLNYTKNEIIDKPDYFWAYYNKVGAEIGQGEIELAKESFNIALKKNSGFEILQNILFQFEFMKKIKLIKKIDYFIDILKEEIKLKEIVR